MFRRHWHECANLERVWNIFVTGACKGCWSSLLVEDFLRLAACSSATICLHHDCSRLCRSHIVHRSGRPSHNGTLIVLLSLILHHERQLLLRKTIVDVAARLLRAVHDLGILSKFL